ncbi:MAG: hypothetical protein ABIK53_04150 [bacterium]
MPTRVIQSKAVVNRSVFDIHGVRFEISSNREKYIKWTRDYIYFAEKKNKDPQWHVHINEIKGSFPLFPPETSKKVRSKSIPIVYENGNLLWFDFFYAVARINLTSKSIAVWIKEFEGLTEFYFTNIILFNILNLILSYNGMIFIHSASLCYGGKGIILAGEAGAGKSTLSVGLIERGCKFLSDDKSIIHLNNNKAEILSFPEAVSLQEDACSFFTTTRPFAKQKNKLDKYKKIFRINSLYCDSAISRCEPSLIIFLHKACGKETFAKKITKKESLDCLIGSISTSFITESAVVFKILAELADSVRSYRLALGENIDKSIEAILGLIRSEKPL